MTSQPAPSAAPMSKERLRLWLKLLKASGQIQNVLRRQLRAEFATTLPRFDVMAALARTPDGLRMSDLSAQLRVSNGNVTGIVERLVEEGLALRVAVQGDRRATVARLTPKGLAAFTDQAQAHEAWIDDMMGALSADEMAAMSDQLDKILHQSERADNAR